MVISWKLIRKTGIFVWLQVECLIKVARLGHGIEQALAISVALKNRLPFVATECHMVNRPVECDASWTHHMPPLAESQTGIQCLYFILGIDPVEGQCRLVITCAT
jgi:hypothetical protein